MSSAPTRPRLVRYRGGEAQASHSHDRSYLSVLLTGEVREEQDRHEYDLIRPAFGWKPAGLRHANRFGPSGALILSICVPEESEGIIVLRPGWHGAGAPIRMAPLVRQCIFCPDPLLRAEAVSDLVALAGAQLCRRPSSPPPWLNEVRKILREDPSPVRLDWVAERVGVHRVHLSRSFSAYFGIPPSVYRLSSMVARTVALLEDPGTSLADAAHGGDFSDHAHAARAVKRSVGMGLGEMRRWFAEVTPVQADSRLPR